MKNSTKLLAAGSMLAGGLIGILLSPGKGSDNRRKLRKQLRKAAALLNGNCSREKLLIVNKHLHDIDARLAAYNTIHDESEA